MNFRHKKTLQAGTSKAGMNITKKMGGQMHSFFVFLSLIIHDKDYNINTLSSDSYDK